VLLVSISLAVITLDYREGVSGPLAGLGRTALAAMAPLQSATSAVIRPIENFFVGIVHLPSLAGDNQRLQREVRDLRIQIQDQTYVQSQLDHLQQLLGLQQSLSPPSVAALVIGSDVSNFQWTITINKGSDDGLAADMPVVAGSPDAPALVGKIVRVSPNASQVQLIIDDQAAVAGRLSTSGETGLVQGQGDGPLKMTLVTPGTQVQGDETVVTQGYAVNGQSGLFPPGIVIGRVSRVVPGASELQEFVTVEPAVDFSALDFVLVLQTSRSRG